MYDAKLMCSKDNDEKYYGECECAICRKNFKWTEDQNADVIVNSVSLEGAKTFLDLEVIAKCSHCNHKYKYYWKAKGDEYRD